MSKAPKIYVCKHCGRIVGDIHDGGTLVCCGEPMTEMIPNTVDAAKEKHVPVTTLTGNKLEVNVGSVDHPMTAEHLIEWIMVFQDGHTQRVQLEAGCKPSVSVCVNPAGGPVEVFAYCNLHGLWKA